LVPFLKEDNTILPPFTFSELSDLLLEDWNQKEVIKIIIDVNTSVIRSEEKCYRERINIYTQRFSDMVSLFGRKILHVARTMHFSCWNHTTEFTVSMKTAPIAIPIVVPKIRR